MYIETFDKPQYFGSFYPLHPMKYFFHLLVFIFCSGLHLHAQNSLLLKQNYFEHSIVSGTMNSLEHQTLAEAVKAAELDEILDSDGPFTIFAPFDGAFERFTPEKLASLMQPENKAELKRLLSYHIIAGNFSASKLLLAMCRGGGTAKFRTIQGNVITTSMDGIDIVLSDSLGNQARIVTADDRRCNGVIHVIDGVIFPE